MSLAKKWKEVAELIAWRLVMVVPLHWWDGHRAHTRHLPPSQDRARLLLPVHDV